MDKKSFIILSMLFLALTFVSAGIYDDCSIYGNCQPVNLNIATAINYSTVSVNDSQYLQGLTPSEVASLVDLSNYVPYTGATSNLDLGANNFSVNNNAFFVNAINNYVGVGINSPQYKLDVYGLTNDDLINSWIGINLKTVAEPTTLTGTAISGTGLGIGNYYYVLTYVTAIGETSVKTSSAITTTSGNQNINLTLSVSDDPRVISKRIYRSAVGGNIYTVSLLAEINNSVINYIDNTPDASLPAVSPNLYYKDDTTNRYITLDNSTVMNFGSATSFGYQAGEFSDGYQTSSFGYQAGRYNTQFGTNFFGYQAGYSNSGFGTVGVGYSAGRSNTGSSVIAMGYQAGQSNTGSGSSMLGYQAGYSNTGTRLTSLGYSAGRLNSGANSVGLGYYALEQNTGVNTIGIGYYACRLNTGASSICIGYQSGMGNSVANQFIVKQNNINSIPLMQGDFLTGNLGIGTTTPQNKLNVIGEVNATQYIVNASIGYSGTCVNVTYSGGIAVSCND